jgi:hypothetical protein
MMGFHIRDRSLPKQIAALNTRLEALEHAQPHVVNAINALHLRMLQGPASPFDAAAQKQREFTEAQMAERARIKAALHVMPDLA